MDIFCEHIVKRKKQRVDYILEGILIFVALYISLIIFLNGFFGMFSLLAIAGIWYGVIYLMRRKNVEYEYTLTDTNLDIDRIFAKKTRRRITSVDIVRIDSLRPANKNDYEKNPEFTDHFICEDRTSDNNYVLIFARGGKVHRVFITPNNKMKRCFKEINPSRVTVDVEEEKE